MMRAMRVIYKPVFVVVAVTFIGWLAYGQVTDILGGGRDVVLKVNGEIVRATQFQAALQNAIDESRRRGGGRLSREDEQQLQDQVTDQFIQRILLEREYRRLGIQVSDDEIRQMARSTPPPQILRQIMEDPTFQTNGQFDITKWQRYLGSASEEFRAQIEQLYREYLPERKLEEYLTADVYVSDAKLWRIWRDQHESVTVAVLAIRPPSWSATTRPTRTTSSVRRRPGSASSHSPRCPMPPIRLRPSPRRGGCGRRSRAARRSSKTSRRRSRAIRSPAHGAAISAG